MFNKTLKGEGLYGTPRVGFMENSDGYASVKGICGDTIAIWLRIESERIIEATYDTDGCYPSIISGKTAAQLSQGMTLEDAYQIEMADIIDAVGGLPDEFHHCAQLAVRVLREAIGYYYRHRRDGRRCAQTDGSTGTGGEYPIENAYERDE